MAGRGHDDHSRLTASQLTPNLLTKLAGWLFTEPRRLVQPRHRQNLQSVVPEKGIYRLSGCSWAATLRASSNSTQYAEIFQRW